jgi:hypothetical protein
LDSSQAAAPSWNFNLGVSLRNKGVRHDELEFNQAISAIDHGGPSTSGLLVLQSTTCDDTSRFF